MSDNKQSLIDKARMFEGLSQADRTEEYKDLLPQIGGKKTTPKHHKKVMLSVLMSKLSHEKLY